MADTDLKNLERYYIRHIRYPRVARAGLPPIRMEKLVEDHGGMDGHRKVGYRFGLEGVLCPGVEHEELLGKMLESDSLTG